MNQVGEYHITISIDIIEPRPSGHPRENCAFGEQYDVPKTAGFTGLTSLWPPSSDSQTGKTSSSKCWDAHGSPTGAPLQVQSPGLLRGFGASATDAGGHCTGSRLCLWRTHTSFLWWGGLGLGVAIVLIKWHESGKQGTGTLRLSMPDSDVSFTWAHWPLMHWF